MVGDTMLVPIAPAGKGAEPGSPIGDMLRRSARPHRWIGLALRVADLPAADAWFRERGFTLHYDPGMEQIYFLIGRGQAMGMRLEVMAHDLPGDPRLDSRWSSAKWRDDHPLGIEGLQSIGLSTTSLDEARALFADRLDWPEIGVRALPHAQAQCAAFLIGDTVLEAMAADDPAASVATHARDTKGIQCLTFKVRSAQAAADYLETRGFELIGSPDTRFAIAPDQAHGRLIWFTGQDVPGYPATVSQLRQPARFST